MKKENILVVAIICIAIAGALIYFNLKPDNNANANSNSLAHQATGTIVH